LTGGRYSEVVVSSGLTVHGFYRILGVSVVPWTTNGPEQILYKFLLSSISCPTNVMADNPITFIYNNPLCQCFRTFFGSRHPYIVFKIFGGTLASLIGIKIREMQQLAVPLALVHGTLVCRGTPVGNHCST